MNSDLERLQKYWPASLMIAGGLVCVCGLVFFSGFLLGAGGLVAGIGFVFVLAREVRPYGTLAYARHCCQQCGYDLRGITTATCPECGNARIPEWVLDLSDESRGLDGNEVR